MKSKLILYYEFILFVLTLLAITAIFINDPLLKTIDIIVYAIFVTDVTVRLLLSKNKIKFIQNNIWDFIAIIPFDSIFKVARLIRLFKLLRCLSILKRYTPTVLNILNQHGLMNALVFITVTITSLSVPVYLVEPNIKNLRRCSMVGSCNNDNCWIRRFISFNNCRQSDWIYSYDIGNWSYRAFNKFSS